VTWDQFEDHVRKVYADESSPVLLNSDQVKAIVSEARHELIERCIAVSFRWAVLRGTSEAREAAYDVARELRELEKEG
jgi:hypothetical protein